MKNEQQIYLLNRVVLTKLAPSDVHGVGVFALKDIPAETKLHALDFPVRYDLPYEEFDKLDEEVAEYIVNSWPSVTMGAPFFFPYTNIQAFMNHNDNPNYNNLDDTITKDIKAGEEIFEDYRNISGWQNVFPWILEK